MVFRITADVVDVSDALIEDRPTHGDIPPGRLWKPTEELCEFRFGHAVLSVERNHFTIEPVQSGKRRIAEPSRAPDDSVEDRLQVSGRASDNPEYFACRSLLLQRLLEFVEQ